MVLTQRERYIAYGVAGLVGLLAANYLLWSPYFTTVDKIDSDLLDVNRKLADARDLFARQRKLRAIWDEMQASGLSLQPSLAESRAQQAVLLWAESAGVTLTSLKPEHQTQEGAFQEMGFEVVATGATPSVSRLLWSMESASIPIRLNEVQIASRKEGSDDLTVRLSVSILCLPASSQDNKANNGSRASASDETLARSGS